MAKDQANPSRTRADHGRRFPVSVNLCPVDLYALAPRSPGALLTVTRAGRRRAGRFVQLRIQKEQLKIYLSGLKWFH